MPVTFVSASSGQSTANADPCVIARPSPAPVAGDVIVAGAVVGGSTDPVITPPAGYALVQGLYDVAAPGVRLSQYVKVSSGTEAATDTWSKDVPLGMVVTYTVYRGVDNTTPVVEKAIVAQSGASVTARPTPSLTTAGSRLVRATFCDASGSTWTAPAGVTQRATRTRTSSASVLAVDTGTEVAAGTYAYTATASASTSVAVQAILALQAGSIANQAPTSSVSADRTQAVEPGETIAFTLTDADDVAVTARTLRVVSGPALTFAGSGGTRTAVAPHTLTGGTIVVGYRVTDGNGQQSDETTVTIQVLRSDLRMRRADGTDVPVAIRIETAPTPATGSFVAASATTPGDIAEPTYSRVLPFPGVSGSNSAAQNLAALRAVLLSTGTGMPGDCYTLPTAFSCPDNVRVERPGITVKGAAGGTVITMPNAITAGWQWQPGSDNGRLQGITIDVLNAATATGTGIPTGRGDKNQQGMAPLLIEVGVTGVVIQDVVSRGAKAAGCFMYGCIGTILNRVRVLNSLADGFHIVRGAHGIRGYDTYVENSGDDMLGVVSDEKIGDPISYQPYDVEWHRPVGRGNTHGRGFGLIGARNFWATNIDLQGTSAAGVHIARESKGGIAVPVSNVRITGQNVLRNCNNGTEVGAPDNGSFFIGNTNADADVTGIYAENFTIIDTGIGRNGGVTTHVREVDYNGGSTQGELKNFAVKETVANTVSRTLFGGITTGHTQGRLILTGWSKTSPITLA